MAVPYNLIKTFNAWKGLDLRSSDITRTSEYASDLNNLQYRKTGAMTKRKGYKWKADSSGGGCGVFRYTDIDNTNGAAIERLVSISDTLNELKTGSISITYSGSNTAYVDLILEDDGNFYLNVFEDNALISSIALGNAVDSPSFVSVADLVLAIDALTGFTAIATGDDTVPACFANATKNLTITASATNIEFNYWEALDSSISSPFQDIVDNKNNSNFENASFVNINNILYIGSRFQDLYKFDGTKVYKAGMPQANIISATNIGPGNVPNTPTYITVYRYTDAKGNIITGIPSNPVEVAASNAQIELDITSIDSTSGFDAANVIIEIYRNKNGGLGYFLVDEIANIPGTNQTYIDDKVDADVLVEYIVPLKPHGLPPKLAYITLYQGLLIGTGNTDNVNTVFYSDIDSPEYFPPADNSFNTEGLRGGPNSGIKPLGNSLFVFKNSSIYQILGNMADDVFSVDLYGQGDIGAEAHATIEEVNGNLMFLSNKGVYSLSQTSQTLQQVSEIIEPIFTSFKREYTFKRATAINWLEEDKYMVYLPIEDTNNAFSDTSIVLAYDYLRDAWLKWSNINAAGGFCLLNRDLYFVEYSYDAISAAVRNNIAKFFQNGNEQDYADHNAAISFTYKSHWEHLGEPSVFKKFLRTKVHSLDPSLDDFESDSFELELRSEIDWTLSISTQTFLDFRGNQDGWGDSAWGLFPWGNERLNSIRTKMKQTKCKAIRLILLNDKVNENVLISGIEMECAAPYQGFIKE